MTIQDPTVAIRTLYDRLGGRAGITAIVKDIMAAHLANPLVGHRFKAIEDLDRATRMACDFFCAGAGGPQDYAGRDMRTAHKGMNVSDQEFDAVVEDVATVLRRHGIDERTREEVSAILRSFRPDIVNG